MFVCPRCSRLLDTELQDVKVGDGARRRGRRYHRVRRGARAVINGVIGVVVAFVNNAGAVGTGGAAAIARALITRPRLVVADEPTSALDDANAARMIDLMFDVADATGATLLVATHDGRIAHRFANRLNLMAPVAA